ncbi:MAG: recombinase, partial [Neobacillus sp.]|nr:recombinase [Neobacillus sp.]
PNTKRLKIKNDEVEDVQAIFDFYANGIILKNGKRKLVQFRALATYLTRLGIKTPKGKSEWSAIQVRQFLESERYIGILRTNTRQKTADGKRVPRPENEHIIVYDAHPAIIDMDTWNKVQDRINNREGTTNTKLDFDPCELAGICVCKKCGRKFIRRAAIKEYKKTDGTISHYNNEFLFCGTVSCTYVKYRSVEDDLLETLKYLRELDANNLKKQLETIVVNEPAQTSEDISKLVNSRKEDLNRRMKFIYEKYEAGIYKDNEFVERRADIEKELFELEKVGVEEDVTTPQKNIELAVIKSNIESVLEAYKKATRKEDKNKLLHSVFDHVNIDVIQKGTGRRPATYVLEPFLKSSFLVESV